MTLHANLYCLNTCAVQRFEMHDVCPISYFNQAILTNFLASRRLFPFRPQELATVFRLKQPRINIRVNQGPVHRWELCWVVWIPFAWLNKQTSSGLDDISLYFHFIAARIRPFGLHSLSRTRPAHLLYLYLVSLLQSSYHAKFAPFTLWVISPRFNVSYFRD